MTLEALDQSITEKVGEGRSVEWIGIWGLDCDADTLTQIWGLLLSRINDRTSVNRITFHSMKGATGSDVMSLLVNSSFLTIESVNSHFAHITNLCLNDNSRWFNGDKGDEAFALLLVFLGRLTRLEEFTFHMNGLSTSKTMHLLQCITESNKKIKILDLSSSCNFKSKESMQALAHLVD